VTLRRLDSWLRRMRDDVADLNVTEAVEASEPFGGTLRDYIGAVAPRFVEYEHVGRAIDVLQRVADGELDRVMVFMPPRHGKTELVSRLFTGYYVHRYPERWVGLSSYAAELAHGFSRRAKSFYQEGGGALSAEASAVKEWETPQGGGLWAAGARGPLTGRGFHLGIIDDPTKGPEDAESELQRLALQEWYRSVFRTRAEPGSAIVIVLTRWHDDDLAGWLLGREPMALERWHIVNFEALREEEDPVFPDSCAVEPDWREPGEPLCPERFSLERLEQTRRSIGPRAWASLYQQRPRPREGDFFRTSWFEAVDDVPHDAERVRYWDTAGTDGRGDYTVGVLMARASTGTFYVEDVVRGQWSPGKRDEVIRHTAARDRQRLGWRAPDIWLEEEAGVAGKDRTRATVKLLAGHTVRTERPTGSKEVRADPLAAQAEIGNVLLVRGDWNTAFLDELAAFPHGKNDDQVDAASGALSKVSATLGGFETMEFVL